jgi:GINS complex subunit 2
MQDRTFLAQDTLIDIIPNFSSPILHLLSGDYGPFRPPHRTRVPLWLAVHLRKGGNCTILLPPWLDADYLAQKLKEEKDKPDQFSSIEYFWIEIYSLLVACAEDDFVNLDKIQMLIQQLKEARHYKIMEGLNQVDSRPIRLKNIGCSELYQIKPYILKAANMLTDYETTLLKAKAETANTLDSQKSSINDTKLYRHG